MKEEYKIILNVEEETFNIIKKPLIEEGYEIIAKEEKLIFIKKSKNNLTEEQIKRIIGMFKIRKAEGILFVDITSAVNYLLTIPENEIKNNGRFSWMIRQAYTKAIMEKSTLQMKGEMPIMDLKSEIEKYIPYNEQEKCDKELMLEYIDTFEDVLTRENKLCHFTASNWIVNKERTKILMIYHNIYESWAWTGGHADGDSNLLNVALKEAREETGLKNLKVLSDGIFSLQILTVDSHMKRGKFVSSHLHLDCCFLLEADENESLKINEHENSGVKWIDIDKVIEISNEKNMKPIYKKLNEKLKI